MDDDDAGAQAPRDVVESSRKRSARAAGHEQDDAARGDEQPDQGSFADSSITRPLKLQERSVQECRRGDGSAFGIGQGACSF